jgi:hypothetical protein
LTRRSSIETDVGETSFSVPSSGFGASFVAYDNAAIAVSCFWSCQARICG